MACKDARVGKHVPEQRPATIGCATILAAQSGVEHVENHVLARTTDSKVRQRAPGLRHPRCVTGTTKGAARCPTIVRLRVCAIRYEVVRSFYFPYKNPWAPRAFHDSPSFGNTLRS